MARGNAKVTFRLSERQIQQLLTSSRGPVVRNMLVRGYRIESAAKRNLGGGRTGPRRIDTGRLRASISTQLVRRGSIPIVRIGTNVEYAVFVHDGTGVHGPKHAPIKAKQGKYLCFKPRGARRRICVPVVQGMEGNPFLLAALPAGIDVQRA